MGLRSYRLGDFCLRCHLTPARLELGRRLLCLVRSPRGCSISPGPGTLHCLRSIRYVRPVDDDEIPTDSPAEWRGRSDGLLAHVFFRGNANFALSIFAFTVEGWIYYSAVNTIVPQVILHLGFETDAWKIAVRQLSYVLPSLFASIPIAWYATAFKDLKTPLIVTFSLFLVA